MEAVGEGGWLATAWRIGRLVGVAYVLYLGLVFAVQRKMAFPGTFRDPPRSTPVAPDGVEQLWLETSVGRVEAWLFLADPPDSAATVIFAHGNGELIDDWQTSLATYAAAGVNVAAVEFPGYGHSAGAPTRASVREAFVTAYDVLAAREDIDPDRIVAHGRSMGGGAATELAGSGSPRRDRASRSSSSRVRTTTVGGCGRTSCGGWPNS